MSGWAIFERAGREITSWYERERWRDPADVPALGRSVDRGTSAHLEPPRIPQPPKPPEPPPPVRTPFSPFDDLDL